MCVIKIKNGLETEALVVTQRSDAPHLPSWTTTSPPITCTGKYINRQLSVYGDNKLSATELRDYWVFPPAAVQQVSH